MGEPLLTYLMPAYAMGAVAMRLIRPEGWHLPVAAFGVLWALRNIAVRGRLDLGWAAPLPRAPPSCPRCPWPCPAAADSRQVGDDGGRGGGLGARAVRIPPHTLLSPAPPHPCAGRRCGGWHARRWRSTFHWCPSFGPKLVSPRRSPPRGCRDAHRRPQRGASRATGALPFGCRRSGSVPDPCTHSLPLLIPA